MSYLMKLALTVVLIWCVQVMMKEAVVDDADVVRGLLEFANRNLIHSIVVGASAKNPLSRFR